MEVYVKTHAGHSVNVYHTDEACPMLEFAKNTRAVDRSVLFDDVSCCKHCQWRNGQEAGGP